MKRLYSAPRWRRERITFPRRNPLCLMCMRNARVAVARVVDHIEPHRGDEILFFDQANWQALCFNCHNSRKQSTERRGYDTAVDERGYPTDPRHPWNR